MQSTTETTQYDDHLVTTFEYNRGQRFFALFVRASTIAFGLLLFLTEDLIAILLGLFLILFLLWGLIDLVLFKDLEVYTDRIVKRWYLLGESTIAYDAINVVRANNVLGGGTIYFWQQGNRLQMMTFQLDIMSLGQENVKHLKRTLVGLHIIDTYQRGWHK